MPPEDDLFQSGFIQISSRWWFKVFEGEQHSMTLVDSRHSVDVKKKKISPKILVTFGRQNKKNYSNDLNFHQILIVTYNDRWSRALGEKKEKVVKVWWKRVGRKDENLKIFSS